MKREAFSKDELSLLLFLETRAVDFGGRVDIRHMNSDDIEIAKKWNESEFLEFGRIVMRNHNSDGTHWCKLTSLAFELAHRERIARSQRMWENRRWIGTKESKEINGCPHLSGMNKK